MNTRKKAPVKKSVKKQESLIKPDMNYNWSLNDLLSMSGKDFNTLQSTIALLTSTESFQQEYRKAQEVMALANLRNILTNIMEQGIKDGKITESPQSK